MRAFLRPRAISRPRTADGTRTPLSPPFLLGFNAQVIQLVLFREALILSSGSEASLGLALAAWALFNGAGAFIGWAAVKRGFRIGRLFSLLLALLPIFMAAGVHWARIARGFTDVPGGEQLRFSLYAGLAALILAPVTFLDGFLFVGALDALFPGRTAGRNTSRVYGIESLGSLAGGLVFSFFLVLIFSPFAVAGLLLVSNALFLRAPPEGGLLKPSRLRTGVRLLLFLAGGAVLAFSEDINAASERRRWQTLQPDLDLVETRETRYQNLAVLKYLEDCSLFGNGHLLFTLRSREAAVSGDWDRALPPNFAMLQHLRAPAKVVLVGGGPKGYLNDILEHRPERVDWVEYDREMVDLAERYMLPEEREGFRSPRVRFYATDGRYFVKNLPRGGTDLIFVDVPDPANANLNRYYTREFFQECGQALHAEGVLVIGLSCQPNYIGDDMLFRNGSVYAALNDVEAFSGNVLVTPGTFSFMAAGGILASLTADADELVRRYEARGIESVRFSPYLFYTWFEEDDVRWINEEIFAPERAAGRFQANRDDRPVAYLSDARLLARITGSPNDEKFIRAAEDVLTGAGRGWLSSIARWLFLLPPAAGLLLLILALTGRRREKLPGTGRLLLLLAAAATGFSGIILEMGILFSFQNASGHLYSQMGVIIASYMAGLAAGALWRFQGREDPAKRCFQASLVCMAAGIGASVLLLPALGDAWTGGPLPLLAFTLVTLVVGSAGGLSFQGVSLALEGPGGAGGGLIYTMDILGTCLGGWQAGNILIPYLGIHGTLLAAGGVSILLCLFSIGVLKRQTLP